MLDVSFEGPLTCWMSVLRVPSLAGCQFLEGPLTCLDVMWSLFWSKLDLKMKICPTSGRFGENCLLKLALVYLFPTQWWNKRNDLTSPLRNNHGKGDLHFPSSLFWRGGSPPHCSPSHPPRGQFNSNKKMMMNQKNRIVVWA